MTDNQVCDLSNMSCEPCRGGVAAFTVEEAKALLTDLHDDWTLSSDAKTIRREFTFKGFARAVQMANLVAWLGDKQGHHPGAIVMLNLPPMKVVVYRRMTLFVRPSWTRSSLAKALENLAVLAGWR
jgi:pterin-4a-carbinolamine dehydratase